MMGFFTFCTGAVFGALMMVVFHFFFKKYIVIEYKNDSEVV